MRYSEALGVLEMGLTASPVSRRSREKRAKIFINLIRPKDTDRILDLGGGTGDYISRFITSPERVTIADVSEDAIKVAQQRGFQVVKLAETVALPFTDGQFDVIFCNSVIEHVTGPKDVVRTWADGPSFARQAGMLQREFADEIRRCAHSYFVQTPHKYFPIEAHSWIPFLNVVPRPIAMKLLNFVREKVPWPRKIRTFDWHSLSVADMRRLFPDGEIVIERFLGLPKSIMAVRRMPVPSSQGDSLADDRSLA